MVDEERLQGQSFSCSVQLEYECRVRAYAYASFFTSRVSQGLVCAGQVCFGAKGDDRKSSVLGNLGYLSTALGLMHDFFVIGLG